jgi:hypothetical protein
MACKEFKNGGYGLANDIPCMGGVNGQVFVI